MGYCRESDLLLIQNVADKKNYLHVHCLFFSDLLYTKLYFFALFIFSVLVSLNPFHPFMPIGMLRYYQSGQSVSVLRVIRWYFSFW